MKLFDTFYQTASVVVKNPSKQNLPIAQNALKKSLTALIIIGGDGEIRTLVQNGIQYTSTSVVSFIFLAKGNSPTFNMQDEHNPCLVWS